jgi:hypothetical protein
MGLSTKEESPWDILKRVSESGVTKYKEELPNETAEEVYDPENNRSNEGAKKLLKEGRETVKDWLSFLNDDDEPTKVAPAEAAPKEAAPAEETLTESFTNWFSLFNSEPEEKVAPKVVAPKVTGGSSMVEEMSIAIPDNTTKDYLLKVEGIKNHIDLNGTLTMRLGLVPDKGTVKFRGNFINPVTGHGVTSSTINEVDFSNAEKTFGGVTIKRSNYDSDDGFVLAAYEVVRGQSGKNLEGNSSFKGNWSALPTEAQEAIIDTDFNTGTNIGAGSRWNDTALMANEMLKPLGERKTANLIKFTDNFLSDGYSPRGLLRRRLMAYNKVALEGDEAAFIKQHKATRGNEGGVRMDVLRADGTLIVSWVKHKSQAVNKGEEILFVDSGEVANAVPIESFAQVDLTDWANAIT